MRACAPTSRSTPTVARERSERRSRTTSPGCAGMPASRNRRSLWPRVCIPRSSAGSRIRSSSRRSRHTSGSARRSGQTSPLASIPTRVRPSTTATRLAWRSSCFRHCIPAGMRRWRWQSVDRRVVGSTPCSAIHGVSRSWGRSWSPISDVSNRSSAGVRRRCSRFHLPIDGTPGWRTVSPSCRSCSWSVGPGQIARQSRQHGVSCARRIQPIRSMRSRRSRGLPGGQDRRSSGRESMTSGQGWLHGEGSLQSCASHASVPVAIGAAVRSEHTLGRIRAVVGRLMTQLCVGGT
jgi:hypothetical protein